MPVPSTERRDPGTSGRTPYASRNPRMPNPASIIVQAQPPSQRSYIGPKLANRSSCLTRAFLVSFSSFGEHVQHRFAVTVSVDAAVCFMVQKLFKACCVYEVAVVHQANPIRAVHVERSSFGIG